MEREIIVFKKIEFSFDQLVETILSIEKLEF